MPRTTNGSSGSCPDGTEAATTWPELQQALRAGEIRLEYQPEFDLSTRRVLAVEALARWDHPTQGELRADRFVELAEQDGLIVEFGAWALRTACLQYAAWQRLRPALDLVLRVNVSTLQLSEPSVVDIVRTALTESGVPAESLCLEITEKAEPLDARVTTEVLAMVRELGVAVALDDFGTGRNGLLELRELSFDVVKIDRAFVTDLAPGTRDSHIVAAVVGLARSLGLDVVAEGVENEVAIQELLRLGCHRGQGYLLGAPVAADQLLPRYVDQQSADG
jgi:EAL domain-containing protein (putative c-di-GMP-specific phosphodiesterase class I)